MALSAGDRIGAYEIVSPLGAGGMGEVYRAKDSKLKREVAIKVLPAELANDPERLARFQREAEVLASLNHPHIAHVYGLEANALVMELVEGEDLAERLKRGPIPLDEALPIARQIAEALEAAHDHGIVHRDLKPANVKVRPDGTVKVLDFGLAKALEPGAGSRESGAGKALADSPTITSPAMTMRGVIIGTAAYMAPEQAKGKYVDRRADIWAFGCVLYEMLTGRRTFEGEDVSDTLVSILRDDPRWAALPSGTPPHIQLLLRRCLQKDPQKRLPHIGAARIELAEADTGELTRVIAPSNTHWRVGAAIGAIAGAAAMAGVVYLMRPSITTEPPSPIRFTIEAPADHSFTGANNVPRFAVSPDGRHVIYQLQDRTDTRLWLRALDSLEAHPLAGTEGQAGGLGGQQPFWSPDGRYIAFFDEPRRQLKKLDRSTSLVQVITGDVPGNQMSGSWSKDDVIIYSTATTDGIRRLTPSGEGAAQLTTLDKTAGEVSHLWPEFLPDGRHFVYLVAMTKGPPAVFIRSLDGGAPRRLFESPSMVRAAWPDRLLFIRDGTLVSQRLDLTRLALTDDPMPIAPNNAITPSGRIGVSAAARANVVAYADGVGPVPGQSSETSWVDRRGRPLNQSPPSVPVGVSGVRLSPDGRAVIYGRGEVGRGGDILTDLWTQDTVRGIETRLATGVAPGTSAIFSPDGTQVIYRALSEGRQILLEQPVSGATSSREIFRTEFGEVIIPVHWMTDGRIVVVRGGVGTGTQGIWIFSRDGSAKPELYIGGAIRGAALSPDERWMAYVTGRDGVSAQVFIQSFPDPTAGKWPVSEMGAGYPRWRRDGRELFFLDAARRLMAARVTISPRVEIAVAVPLFELGGAQPSGNLNFATPFDVMPDGERFVAMRAPAARQAVRLIVMVNDPAGVTASKSP